MGDQALVAALRCEDEGALREFFLRFRPALVARGSPAPGRSGRGSTRWWTTAWPTWPCTSSRRTRRRRDRCPAYLARSLRNRVLNGLRARARAERALSGTWPEEAGDRSKAPSPRAARTTRSGRAAPGRPPPLARRSRVWPPPSAAPLDDEDRAAGGLAEPLRAAARRSPPGSVIGDQGGGQAHRTAARAAAACRVSPT